MKRKRKISHEASTKKEKNSSDSVSDKKNVYTQGSRSFCGNLLCNSDELWLKICRFIEIMRNEINHSIYNKHMSGILHFLLSLHALPWQWNKVFPYGERCNKICHLIIDVNFSCFLFYFSSFAAAMPDNFFFEINHQSSLFILFQPTSHFSLDDMRKKSINFWLCVIEYCHMNWRVNIKLILMIFCLLMLGWRALIEAIKLIMWWINGTMNYWNKIRIVLAGFQEPHSKLTYCWLKKID